MAEGSLTMKVLTLESEAAVCEVLKPLRGEATASEAVVESVRSTLAEVRARGDEAVLEAVRAHDWPCPSAGALRVPARELESAARSLPAALREALTEAARSIRRFHEGQRPATCAPLEAGGLRAGVRTLPLASAGLYVPGGRAAYPSTLLMLAIPAQIAGVRRIAVASPARPEGLPNRAVLAAAALLGLEEVYAVGGAAAVAALAFGTPSIPPVDKILGPGNAYVAEAKRQLFGWVGIDAIAGPTELVILSDGSSPAAWVAADLLAQAEHDAVASALLLTTDPEEPERVLGELERRLDSSPREAIQRQSLKARGALIACGSRAVACAAAEFLAPEHLSVQAAEPEAWAEAVPSAAAVFLGPWAPEAAGDYGAGPNHSLPTGGTARFSSPVGVWDFVRCQSYLSLDRRAFEAMSGWMELIAEAEGLCGHAASLRVRGGVS
ncbi:MAG: histidinol dehydrogenase [Acidobacteriota bacterium]